MSFRDFCQKENHPMQTTPTPAATRRVPPRKPAPQPKRPPMTESSDILAESQEMIATLQEKIQQVFYRFGMAGLERLDEAIIETCQQMMYPDGVPTQRRSASQRQPARQAARQAAAPVRQQQAPRCPQSIEEIAAAALRTMPPMNAEDAGYAAQAPAPAPAVKEQASMPAVDSSRRAFNPLTDMAPSAPSVSTDYMAQFADVQLSPEELAIIQQGLAQEN